MFYRILDDVLKNADASKNFVEIYIKRVQVASFAQRIWLLALFVQSLKCVEEGNFSLPPFIKRTSNCPGFIGLKAGGGAKIQK